MRLIDLLEVAERMMDKDVEECSRSLVGGELN